MAEQFTIQRAERRQSRLRVALCASSNGGKTWSALELAFGLAEQLIARGILKAGPLAEPLAGLVGVVDTERKSAPLYSHLGPFDTIQLGPPYSVERYVGAMQALERAGCAIIIVDQISHAWSGAGGVLHLLDRFEHHERFSAFNTTVNPAQDEFVDAMLRSACHVIATMRSKTAWVLEDKENRHGKMVKTPRRIGMEPIQRPGIEYEFTTLLDLDTDSHFARVVKNRCPVFANWQPKMITREHGRQLADWLLEGAPEPTTISGTPLERAKATAEASVRAMGRVTTLPDLARAFDEAQRSLKSFPPAVAVDDIRPLLEAVVAAKDRRKGELGPTATPMAPTADNAPRPGGRFSEMKDDIPW